VLGGLENMKCILLAAGRGTRISRHIQAIPKSTLPIDGNKPLIRYTVEMLIEMGIEPIVCAGYKRDNVHDALSGLDVKFYYNPFYSITNSIASLWFAKDELEEDTIVMNADVFLEKDFITALTKNECKAVMASDSNPERKEKGDFFFSVNENSCISKYGKDLPLEDRDTEYVGIAKISSRFIGQFKDRLESLIEQGHFDAWWENVLYSFADLDEEAIETIDVGKYFWREIDYIDEYEEILNYVKMKKRRKEDE